MAYLQMKPVHQELSRVAWHFLYSVLMIFSLRVRSWLLSEQSHCVYVKFRQRILLNVKLADWQDIWYTQNYSSFFRSKWDRVKSLCIAKKAVWSVCLKIPCPVIWRVCACAWLNLTVTFRHVFHASLLCPT